MRKLLLGVLLISLTGCCGPWGWGWPGPHGGGGGPRYEQGGSGHHR